MTRHFRFKVDLRQVDGLQGASRASDKLDLAPQGKQAADALAAIALLEPARVDPSAWADPLEAQELLDVYNASLRRGQSMAFGRYLQGNIEYNVVLDEWGNKRVISRPTQRPGSRVSELMLGPHGGVMRFSYEHEGGPQEVTDDLMQTGLEHIESDPSRLERSKGYVLRTTVFERNGPLLISFGQKMQSWDPTTGTIVATRLD